MLAAHFANRHRLSVPEIYILYRNVWCLTNISLFTRLMVLLSIRKGVIRLKHQMQRLLEILSSTPPASMSASPVSVRGPKLKHSINVTEWVKSQPKRISRSPSYFLPNTRNMQEVVEETSLLNSMV